jgi:hypothetical protein
MSERCRPARATPTNSKAPVVVSRTPSNLRFQRRTSERAYLEGALREGGTLSATTSPTIMDYSAEHAGASPWASSPDASRTSFGDAPPGSVPREDLPGPAMHEEHHGQDANGQPYAYPEQHEQQHPAWTPEQRQQQQYQYQQQHHHASHDQQRSSGEENRRPQSARYHNVHHQQPRQQHMPQYKLQAKITGLERTGKKDPILRFDVYVCQVYTMLSVSAKQPVADQLSIYRPTCPSSEPPNSATSAAPTPSSSSLLST